MGGERLPSRWFRGTLFHSLFSGSWHAVGSFRAGIITRSARGSGNYRGRAFQQMETYQADTISTIEYGLLVSTTRFRRTPHFATRSEYSSLVRSRPPGSTIMTMSSSFERCGSGEDGTTDSINN